MNSAREAAQAGSPRRLILVQGDGAASGPLRFWLEAAGYDVLVLETAQQLLAQSLPGTPCCLVVDHRLTDMTGVAAIARLRRQGVELPAILLTWRAGVRLQRAAQLVNARIVEKPLLDGELIAALSKAFERDPQVSGGAGD